MPFTKTFEPFYSIMDNEHQYALSYLSHYSSGEIDARLLSISSLPYSGGYNDAIRYSDFEIINKNINVLQKLANTEGKFCIDGKVKQLTFGGFDVVKVEPQLVYNTETKEHIQELYEQAITDRLAKKRCKLNKIMKSLDISKLTDADIVKLEGVVGTR